HLVMPRAHLPLRTHQPRSARTPPRGNEKRKRAARPRRPKPWMSSAIRPPYSNQRPDPIGGGSGAPRPVRTWEERVLCRAVLPEDREARCDSEPCCWQFFSCTRSRGPRSRSHRRRRSRRLKRRRPSWRVVLSLLAKEIGDDRSKRAVVESGPL